MVQNAGNMPKNGQKKKHVRLKITPICMLLGPHFRQKGVKGNMCFVKYIVRF